MTILSKLSVKNLKLNKKRSISTIIGIILSVALICGVATLVTSFQETLVQNAIQQNGYYHLSLSDVTDVNIDEIKNNRNILSTNIINRVGYGFLDGIKNEYKPYLEVISMDKDVFENLSFKLIEGEFPKNKNEIIISNHIISNGGVNYKIGDKISVDVGQRKSLDDYDLHSSNPYYEDMEKLENTQKLEFTIVGIIERPGYNFEPYSDPGYTAITTDNALGKKDIFLAFKDVFNYEDEIAKIFGVKDFSELEKEHSNLKYKNFYINTELLRWEAFAFSDSTVSTLYAVAGVVIFIIIFTSVFCIRNSFAIATTEKIKMYGMLASIGTTKKQIRKNVIFEALMLGIIGIPFGILSGIFAIFILLKIVNVILANSLFEGLDGIVFSVSIMSAIISSILGIIVIYFSSISAAKKASKVSPIESLRNSNEIKIINKKLKTPKIISKVFKTGGVLAYKNLKRSKKKYRTTVISIAVSICIFITMNSFLANAFDVANLYYTDYDYNIELYDLEGTENDDFANKIRSLDTVDEVFLKYRTDDGYYMRIFDVDKINEVPDIELVEDSVYDEETKNIVPTGKGKYSSIEIVGLDDYTFKKYCQKIGENYDKIKNYGVLCDEYKYFDEEAENTKIIRRYKYNTGDTIVGEYDDENISIKVGAVSTIKPYGLENTYYGGGFLIVNKDEFKDKEFNLERICINSNNADKTEEEISKMNGNIRIINFEKEAQEEKSMLLVIKIFLYGFISVITLIGVTNIFNTITSNMELRQREFATLKSIGMTKKEFNRMINLETIFYSVKALMYGIILGLIGTYGLYRAFEVKIDSGMYIPVIPIILSIIFVFILVYVIMKYSMKKINKQNIIETIRKENI